MGTAIGVIVCIAVCYGIGWLWEEASKKKGAVGAAARGAEAVADGSLRHIDLMLDAGDCQPGPTSVLDLSGEAPTITRQGFVELELD